MKFRFSFYCLIIVLLLVFNLSCSHSVETGSKQWPSYRGNNANGLSLNSNTPTAWDMENSTNIKWKAEIPGLAHSSPIMWDDHIFITTAVGENEDPDLKVGLYGNIDPVEDEGVHEWKLYCINKNTGDIIWEQTAHKGVPAVKRHPKSTHANSTPVTDGEYVVAFFGSEGLFCYDMSGKLIWEKDFGLLESSYFVVPTAEWGFASSPIIHKGTVIVQCDVLENSFLAALDIKTGNEIWRTPREDVPTWSTPNVFSQGGKTQVVVNGFKHIGGYDFKTGAEIWRLTGGGDIPVPTPQIAHNMIFINNAHGRMQPIYAIKTTAAGDISLEGDNTTNDHIVWSVMRGGAYMVTSIIYGDYYYNCRNNGYVSCFNALTGEKMYEERIGKAGSGFSASPVASNGKLYFTSEQGEVIIIQPGPEFKIIAENSMNDICMATPAISGNVLYFRTHHYLIAISEEK
ncbi:PQQ-binding-like beta-propeller repeat protein [candidate division KSB1 bacterium]